MDVVCRARAVNAQRELAIIPCIICTSWTIHMKTKYFYMAELNSASTKKKNAECWCRRRKGVIYCRTNTVANKWVTKTLTWFHSKRNVSALPSHEYPTARSDISLRTMEATLLLFYHHWSFSKTNYFLLSSVDCPLISSEAEIECSHREVNRLKRNIIEQP